MNKAVLGKKILDLHPELKLSGFKRGAIRFTPIDKNVRVTVLDHIDIILKSGLNLISIISPGEEKSKSSKFNTYEVGLDDKIFYIVFGLGVKGNNGLDFEKKTVLDLQENLKAGTEHKLITSLKDKVPLFNVVDIEEGYGRKIKRPLDLSPYFVGNIIADVTFKLENGGLVFGSLKNITGITISNNGLSKAFAFENNNVVYKGDPLIDLILEELSVDVGKMLQGFNDYKNRTVTPFERKVKIDLPHPDNLKNLIGSAFGYGYYLVKESKNSEYKISDLTTLNKLNDYIGNVKSAELQYPYFYSDKRLNKSKSMVINIETDKHKFAFNIRNNTGGLLPNILSLTTI